MAPLAPKIQVLRDMQRAFLRHTGLQDFTATDGVSPGICHTVARERLIEPGDFVQATDSHTCMGGSLNALAYGVGATEYAALLVAGFTFIEVPESIRFELRGRLQPGVTAKDVMLHILANHARRQETLDRVMEFGGPGLLTLSPDEKAVLCNMATECSAKTGVVEADEKLLRWIAARRPGTTLEALRAKVVAPDPGATYHGGVHVIDLSALQPMVATPGDPARGIPSDPTNGALVSELPEVRIDIAYGGSCTAGKEDDLDQYAQVMSAALAAGRRVAEGVEFFIQFGSQAVEEHARRKGYLEVFERTGVKLIRPGCGACIGCGPGVSERREQVSVSAIQGVPEGEYVYEETLHVIAKPPIIWRGRLGYHWFLIPGRRHSIGAVGDVVAVPGRATALVRAGLVLRVVLSDSLEVRGTFVPTVYSTDQIGILGGDFTELGLRWRWATGR